jgi:hypothetical protein
MPSERLICDGCGQFADPEHIARRLKRLESMTRYRPIHVQALFLGAGSPAADTGYLYSAENEFRGEGLALLGALGIDCQEKSTQAVLTDFQRRGYLLTYVLECPSQSEDGQPTQQLLERGLATTVVRIRRSLKPKKVILLGGELDPFVDRFTKEAVGAELVLSEGGCAFKPEQLAPGSLEALIRVTPVPSL